MKLSELFIKAKIRRFWFSIIMIFAALVNIQSCSVSKTVKNPSYKDLSILKKGTDRAQIIAELGAPVATIKENGATVDVFKFKQGSHTTTKIVKGVGYTVLAIGTLGLSEAIMWPAETTLGAGSNIELKVVYDSSYVIDSVKIYRDDRWIKLSDLKATQQNNKKTKQEAEH